MPYQLIADIGGTNARFAICDKGSNDLKNIQTFSCKDFDSPIAAIKKYLSETNFSVKTACLAIAGPTNERNDFVKLTNNSWHFSKSQMAKQLNIDPLIVINDFVAAAMATVVVDSNNLFFLSQNTQFDLNQQRCILGPGTGLGVAGMLSYNGKTIVLSTEGGNRSFSPENELEDYILQFLRSEMQIVSCEELLSGRGLVNIYRAICARQQQPVKHATAESISEAALNKNDSVASETLQAFFEILGSIAGDYALSFGATGGIYIGGGIAPKFSEALLKSKFRERFENKLNYKTYLEKIPTAILMHAHAGLLGASAYLENK